MRHVSLLLTLIHPKPMRNYPILYDTQKIKFGKLSSASDAIDLFRAIFERSIDQSIVDWFAECPTGANQWYAAFDGHTPVGMYGILPVKVAIGNVIYTAGLANNIGIVPQLRGKGLFQSLSEYAFKTSNYPFILGTPNHKSVKGCLRVGCKSYGILELLSGRGATNSKPPISNQDFQSVPTLKPTYLYIAKDDTFTRWRYAKPGFTYYQSCFGDDRYVIWKTYQGKYQILETNDLNSVFEFGGVVDIWQFKGSTNSDYLKSRGFTPLLTNEFIFYFNQPIEIETDVNRYCFELGDNDVF